MKKRSTKFLSLLLSLLMVVTILPAGTLTAQAADSRVENAISWAVSAANITMAILRIGRAAMALLILIVPPW